MPHDRNRYRRDASHWVRPTSGTIDTLRFDNVVAYSADGVPTLVTFDFSLYDIANVRIWRSIFDSATKTAVEAIAYGTPGACDPPTPCNPPSMSQLSIRETRMGADVVIDDDGDGPLVAHGGSGISAYIGKNPDGSAPDQTYSPAYIKTLDISNNLMTSKQGTGGFFVSIDSETPDRIRAAQIVGNTFGEAIATAQGQMPAAVWLGASNVIVSGNMLHNAREVNDAAPTRVNFFVRTTRANLTNTVLVGNVATVPLGVDFLDDIAQPLSTGKQKLANTGQLLAFVQDRQLTADQYPITIAGTGLNGLSFALKDNTNYRAVATFAWSSSNAGAAAGFAFGLPVTPASFASTCLENINQSGSSALTPTFYSTRTPNQFYVPSSVDAANQPLLATCVALFRTGAGMGNVLNTRAKASLGNAITVRQGTAVKLEELP